jgi:tetratricopeptide (TPR) repeat protein
VARATGTLAERQWGRTIGQLGLSGATGQLTLTSDAKRYVIAFSGGAVIGATSPLQSDAAVRVALTGGLISSTQVADIARRQQAAPQRDEIDLITELARLQPDQTLRLRRRTVLQRAARTFAVERGDYVLDDRITIPIVPGCELDFRSVIYFGARQNLSDVRLGGELALFGAWFRLQPSAFEDLPQFGFTDAERPVLEVLAEGATLDELEATGADVRTARALLYALVCCGACEIGGPGRAAAAPKRATVPPPSRARTSSISTERPRTPTPPPRAVRQTPSQGVRTTRNLAGTPAQGTARVSHPSSAPPQQSSPGHPISRSHSDSEPPRRRTTTRISRSGGAASEDRERAGAIDHPAPARRRASTAKPIANRRRVDSAQAADVRSLIEQRARLIDKKADHFSLLGVEQDTPAEAVRKAYFALARQLHPDRLAALGIDDVNRSAQRLFAQVNTAFAVLSDKQRRVAYIDVLRRGGEGAVRADTEKASEMALRYLNAEQAFQRAEAALGRNAISEAIAELTRAIELDPEEADYHATLAWARFCNAPDKHVAGPATRTALDQAIARAPKKQTARFLLGRVERMLGRDADALRHFHELLRHDPGHREAAAEIRVIEARLSAAATGEKPGQLTRKR